jgi:hypothetical protein
MKKEKKSKKNKLESLPKIHKRLFKLWSEKVREANNNTCEWCGKKIGDIGEGGNPIKAMNAHHLQSRKNKYNPLKWDIRNAVCVCPNHHKFSCSESFHNSPVVTINWLMKNRPGRFKYVLEHFNDKVDLENRLILKEIERCLIENVPLDLEKLQQIEKEFPREQKKPKLPPAQDITIDTIGL